MRARPLLLLLLVALLGFVGRLVWGPGSASESIVGLGQGSPSVPPGHAEAQDAAVREGPETSHLQRRQDLSQREEAHSRYGVSGQVKWEDGSGVADQAVILVEGDTGTTLAETRTDALGGYTIFLPQGDHVSTPPRNSYDLYCPGRALAHADSAHATPDDPPARVDMVLLAGRDLQVLSRHHLDGTPAGDVQVHAVCEIDHEHELFTFTDSDGKGILHIPHEGPWSLTAHTRQLEGYAIGFPITPWLTADRKEVVIEVISQPTEVHLQAVDAVTGAAVEDARFRVARVPEDARFLPPGGLAQLPSPLSQQLGSLHTVFEIPGRAFLKVEAEGFLPEVLEWVEDDRRQHQIPLIPLMPHTIEVTRHGRPVSTEVTIGFNRRSKVLHENELVHDLAAEPQVGTLHRFQTDAQGICDLML
ncbi:MAG: carboxypeptidase-like regulatory domain-containing protein, partial [Planctomycetota bacterium]